VNQDPVMSQNFLPEFADFSGKLLVKDPLRVVRWRKPQCAGYQEASFLQSGFLSYMLPYNNVYTCLVLKCVFTI
jgi:hypothetical protein